MNCQGPAAPGEEGPGGMDLSPGMHMANFSVLVGVYHLSPKALGSYLLGPVYPGLQEESEISLNGPRI